MCRRRGVPVAARLVLWTLLRVSTPNPAHGPGGPEPDTSAREYREGRPLGTEGFEKIQRGRRNDPPIWPIIAGVPVSFGMAMAVMNQAPGIVLLSLVPGVLVIGTFLWLGQIEPGTRRSQMHCVMWGATTAVSAAVVCNSLFGYFFGETAGIVVSAPIVEETIKLLGVWWVVKPHKEGSVLLGAIHAGLVAGGFAMVENIMYFYEAYEDGLLAWAFIGRGILTPFMHPLFTIPAAVALVSGGKTRGVSRLWGLPFAVALHAWWNGSIVLLGRHYDGEIPVWTFFVGGVYIGAFLVAGTGLMIARERTKRLYPQGIAKLAFEHDLTPEECSYFSTWRDSQTARRRLSRRRRSSYDALHSAVWALMRYHSGAKTRDLDSLVGDLRAARLFMRR